MESSWAVTTRRLNTADYAREMDCFRGCDDDADTLGARGGDVVAMPMLGLVGLRGLRELKPPAQPCGVDLLDKTGETVGGDDLHKEG